MDGLTVGHLARRNDHKRPDEEAVVELDGTERVTSFTFAEFDERTDRIANGLAALGVEQGDSVALYMKNNAETLEVFLGVMKLGALPVPVNHRFKGEEVTYVLSDSDARVCVLDAFGAETMAEVHDAPETPVETFLYVGEDAPAFADDYESFLADASADPVDIVPSTLDEAGIMYTSGTTGDPKGCIYTHENLVHLAADGVYEGDYLEPGNRHLVITPLFHVGAFVPFITNFYAGGTTLVVDGFDAEAFLEVVEREAVNSTYLVPTQSRMVLDVDDVESYDLSSLENYGTGAAPSGEELKREIIETLDCDLVESFGQTEALSTRLPTERTLDKPDSVGRPTLNLEMAVLDEDGEELPPGEVGFAAYRGPTVFKRYHNMPEKTDEVFQNGWFVSEDLIRRDEEGFVYFVGRSDDMIITGGENVHPAEIEEVLFEHPAVDECAVLGVPDEEWGERIKAVIVPYEDATLTEEDVVEYVTEQLAGFKKPREVEFREELPRNPTGKVLKDELT
jgi:acyl-CoA synthetase (AMP-forming)/AMP-acid ligase II